MNDREYDDYRTDTERRHASPHSPIPDVVYCAYCGEKPTVSVFTGACDAGNGFLFDRYFCCEACYQQYKLEERGE